MELFTTNEFNIMSLLWAEGKPMSKAKILEKAAGDWKAGSVHNILNRLMEKGAVRIDGFVSAGKTIGRTYAACISEEDYIAFMLSQHERKKPVKLSLLFSALVDAESVDTNDLNKLESLVDELIKKEGGSKG